MKTRRSFLKTMGATLGAAAVPPFFQASHATAKPNVVFILADDMGYGDASFLNPNSKIPTLHLDHLAGEGMHFTDAHSASAVCTPTRYGILTGRYAWRTRLKKGVLWCWDPPLIEESRMTVGKLFQDHGYDTACIGKWHLGMDWPTTDGKAPIGQGDKKHTPDSGSNVDFTQPIKNGPTTRGFDYYFGTAVPNFPPYCFIENEHTAGIPNERKPESMFGLPGPMIEGWELDEILPGLEKKAVEYIDAKGGRNTNSAFRQSESAPFFLYVPLTAPHTPIAPAEKFLNHSQAGRYGDFVHQVDHVVGSILEALTRNGFEKNTLVIFTSDNGSPGRDGTNMSGKTNSVRRFDHNPSHHFRGIKTDIWEGGHRVPFIARWPGIIEPGSRCDDIVCSNDLMATCGEILGHKFSQKAAEDSCSLLPVFQGKKGKREALVHHSGNGMFAIRRGKWKLIWGRGSGGWIGKGKPEDPPGQLYNMKTDPSETKNLYQQHPEIVKQLTALLEQIKKA